jgi:hypothetical protein
MCNDVNCEYRLALEEAQRRLRLRSQVAVANADKLLSSIIQGLKENEELDRDDLMWVAQIPDAFAKKDERRIVYITDQLTRNNRRGAALGQRDCHAAEALGRRLILPNALA